MTPEEVVLSLLEARDAYADYAVHARDPVTASYWRGKSAAADEAAWRVKKYIVNGED